METQTAKGFTWSLLVHKTLNCGKHNNQHIFHVCIIFANVKTRLIESSIIISFISDHLPTLALFDIAERSIHVNTITVDYK